MLLRHAKSDWDVDTGDHDRPLSDRGVKAANAMGKVLAASGQIPDLVITSTAVRARTTAEIAMNAGGWECPIRHTEALYMASVSGVLGEIQRVENAVGAVMLVGHEPTWSTLASILTGGSRIAVKTGTALAIEFNTEHWRGVQAGRGELAWVLPPRLFTDGTFPLG